LGVGRKKLNHSTFFNYSTNLLNPENSDSDNGIGGWAHFNPSTFQPFNPSTFQLINLIVGQPQGIAPTQNISLSESLIKQKNGLHRFCVKIFLK
jgi:hypothetical protein